MSYDVGDGFAFRAQTGAPLTDEDCAELTRTMREYHLSCNDLLNVFKDTMRNTVFQIDKLRDALKAVQHWDFSKSKHAGARKAKALAKLKKRRAKK